MKYQIRLVVTTDDDFENVILDERAVLLKDKIVGDEIFSVVKAFDVVSLINDFEKEKEKQEKIHNRELEEKLMYDESDSLREQADFEENQFRDKNTY